MLLDQSNCLRSNNYWVAFDNFDLSSNKSWFQMCFCPNKIEEWYQFFVLIACLIQNFYRFVLGRGFSFIIKPDLHSSEKIGFCAHHQFRKRNRFVHFNPNKFICQFFFTIPHNFRVSVVHCYLIAKSC